MKGDVRTHFEEGSQVESSVDVMLANGELGPFIKSRRKIMKLSQQELSDLSGLSLATLKRLESGDDGISLKNVMSILQVLGVNLCLRVK